MLIQEFPSPFLPMDYGDGVLAVITYSDVFHLDTLLKITFLGLPSQQDLEVSFAPRKEKSPDLPEITVSFQGATKSPLLQKTPDDKVNREQKMVSNPYGIRHDKNIRKKNQDASKIHGMSGKTVEKPLLQVLLGVLRKET